jgi:GTPase SAR1 family protein
MKVYSNYSPTPFSSYLPIKTVIFNDFQKQILFSITDTSGKKDKFNSFFYYKDCDIFLFVYDLTNEKSLTEIESF